MYLPAKVPLQYIMTPEAEFKEKTWCMGTYAGLDYGMCFQTLHFAPGDLIFACISVGSVGLQCCCYCEHVVHVVYTVKYWNGK